MPAAPVPGRDFSIWFFDPGYDQCCDDEMHVTYTLYTMLAPFLTMSLPHKCQYKYSQ